MWLAFAAALLVGIVIFAIWWGTSPSVAPSTAPSGAKEGKPRPLNEAEFALPRGGALTGSLPAGFDLDAAIAILTDAPLFRINRSTGQVEPWLAESSSVSSAANSSAPSVVARLRPKILRADGTPLVASEVASAINAHAPLVLGKPISARASDPLTVEIVFPSLFDPGLRILDTVPIPGFGPFVVKERNAQGRVVLARNPNYWRLAPDGKPLPYIDTLILESPAARPDLLDFNSNVRPADLVALRKADEARKLRLYDLGPGLEADALWMNLSSGTKPWLRADALRQAISLAVDRGKYCETVFAGMCDPLAGPVTPPAATWFMADLPADHDVARARALLAELGLLDRNRDGVLDDEQGRSVRFTVLVPRGRETTERGAAYLRDELKKIGVAVDVAALEPAVLRARWEKGDYEAIYDRIPVRDTDPAMNLDFWLSSGDRHVWNPRQAKPATEWEAQIDRLMTTQASSSDRVQRIQAFADAQKTFAAHRPAIYFGVPYVYVATSMRLLNARPTPQQPAMLWNAETLAATPQ